MIPKGASNLEILQRGFSDDLNYIGKPKHPKLFKFIFLIFNFHFFRKALMDDQGEYILNGYNVITQYPRTFAYGGVTFEYTGTNSTLERVNTTFTRRLKRDLTIEVLQIVSALFESTKAKTNFYSTDSVTK